MAEFNRGPYNADRFNRVAPKPVTLYLTATDSDLTGGSNFNKVLSHVCGDTPSTISAYLPIGANETDYAFTSAGVPGNALWEANEIIVKFKVDWGEVPSGYTIPTTITGSRVNSSGIVQESTSGVLINLVANDNPKEYTIILYKAWASGSVTDRLRISFNWNNTTAIPHTLSLSADDPTWSRTDTWITSYTGLAGTAGSTSSSSSTLTILKTISIAGSASAGTTISDALLSRTVGIAGALTATSGASGSLSCTHSLGASVAATSTAAASCDVDRIITGLIGGAASLSSTLTLDMGLSFSIAATSNATALFYVLWLTGTYTEESDHIALVWEVW